MAVAKNAGDSGTVVQTTGFSSSAESLSHSAYTVGAGSNIVLLALLQFNNAITTDISGLTVTWDGNAMTRVGTGLHNGGRVEIWWKALTTDTGNKTCAAAWTTISDAVLALISFTGAGTPTDAVTNSGTGTAATTGAIASDANGATVACIAGLANVNSTDTETELYKDNTTWVGSGASYDVSGGATETHSWTINAAVDWAAMGIHLPQASVAATVPELDHTAPAHRPFNMASGRR